MKIALLLIVPGLVLIGFLVWYFLPAKPLAPEVQFDKLEVYKKKRLLIAYSKGKQVRTYLVALGKSPEGHKEFEGDMKTPEGKYTINAKNPNSDYHKNLGVSYPNDKDRAHAKTLGKSPGGDIKIHGLKNGMGGIGKLHRAKDWTHGCIAVTDEEIDELYARTPVGTPIEIFP